MRSWAPFVVFLKPCAIKWRNYFLSDSNINRSLSSNPDADPVSCRLPGVLTTLIQQLQLVNAFLVELAKLLLAFVKLSFSYTQSMHRILFFCKDLFSYIVEPSTPWSLSWFSLLVPREVSFFAVSRGGRLTF